MTYNKSLGNKDFTTQHQVSMCMQYKTKFNDNNRYIFYIYYIKVYIILRIKNQIANNLVNNESETQFESSSRYNTARIRCANKEVR